MPIIYFISDIHLGAGSREEEYRKQRRLETFLEEVGNFGQHLYILGDLFDFWFEYRSVIPRGYHTILSMLDSLRRREIGIDFLRGNHDFAIGKYFTEELGIRVWNEGIETEWSGKKFYLHHGDGLALKDTGYKILKRITRNRFSQWCFRLIHPDCGFRLARVTSRTSRGYTSRKDYGTSDGQILEARRKIAEGFDYVIMGHRHLPLHENIGKGTYINLGDWITHNTYAQFDGAELKLMTYRNTQES